MSVQNLLSTQACGKKRRSSAGQSKPVGLSFQKQLVQTSAAVNGPPIHLRMPGENTVYSGVIWGQSTNQEVYAEYTADSTPEEPIVRVTGVSDSGPYDVTCRIKSIDPSNASYAELAALYGHLVKTGAYQSVLEGPSKPGVLPHTVEYRGDVTQKHDFIHDIRESLKDQHLPTAATGAEELLALYQAHASGGGASSGSSSVPDHSSFTKNNLLSALSNLKSSMLDQINLNKEKTEETQEWEKLMKYLDAWIESLIEEADAEKIARAQAALQAELTKDSSGRKNLDDHLLEQLTDFLSH